MQSFCKKHPALLLGRWPITVLVAIAVLLPFGSAFGKILYSIKDGVSVKKEKSPMSAVVASLQYGIPVEVDLESGRFLQVLLPNGGRGWVYKFNLSDSAPTEQERIEVAALVSKGEVSVQEARSGGSIRTLKIGKNAPVGKVQPLRALVIAYAETKGIEPRYIEAAERMTAHSIPAEALARFQKEGKIGEFTGAGS
jgi:hypothetical protein